MMAGALEVLDAPALYADLTGSGRIAGLTGLHLLKALERESGTLYVERALRHVAEPRRTRLTRACLDANFEGVAEFSDDFYDVLRAGNARQSLMRHFVLSALTGDGA